MIVVYENGDCRVVTRKVTLSGCLQNVRVAIPLIAGATITDVQVPVGLYSQSTNYWIIGDYCKSESTTYEFSFKLCVDDTNTVPGTYPVTVTTDTTEPVSDNESDVVIVVECPEPEVTIDGPDPGECDDCEKIPAINPNFPTYSGLVEDVEDCDIPSEPLDPCAALDIDEDLCLQCVGGVITTKCEEGYTCDGGGECIKIVSFNGESYPIGEGCDPVDPTSGTIIGEVDDCDVPEN